MNTTLVLTNWISTFHLIYKYLWQYLIKLNCWQYSTKFFFMYFRIWRWAKLNSEIISRWLNSGSSDSPKCTLSHSWWPPSTSLKWILDIYQHMILRLHPSLSSYWSFIHGLQGNSWVCASSYRMLTPQEPGLESIGVDSTFNILLLWQYASLLMSDENLN